MPIYEYRCGSCGHELEALQKFSDPVLTQCPSCRADALTKLVSAAGFQLKGSGWYATDFRGNGRKGDKPDAGKDGVAKAPGGDGGDAKAPASEGGETKAGPAACGTGCACH